MELSPFCVMIFLTGLIHVTQAESPKSVVIIKPDTEVFRGERVDFRCDIQEGGDTEWRYDWYKNDYKEDLHHTTQEFSINSVTDTDSGEYTCRRWRRDSQSSDFSDPVTLTVSEKPKPTVSVNPQSSIYTGDNITLSCNLQSTGWRFYWYKDNQLSKYVKTANTHSNTIRGRAFNKGKIRYSCKALRGNYESEFSDSAMITVSERPKPVVKIQPDNSVLIGDTVTLTCNIWTGGSWKYHWYRNNEELGYAAGRMTYTITAVKGSDKGLYSCKGTQSSDPKYTQSSDAVTLTILEKPELTSDLKGDVLTGNSVTLYCTLKPHPVKWKFYWIKDTQTHETETETHSYTISSVNISDGGQYRCRAGRGNPVYTNYSDALWVNVTESPKPVVIIKPDTRVFRKEKVTFICEMQTERDTHWTYTWFSDRFYEPFRGHYQFSIRFIVDYNSGMYRCRGLSVGYQSSKMSDPVGLWVSAKPKPELTSDLKGPALTGNSVTLYCTVKEQSVGWKFYWIKVEQSQESESETHSYTIRSVSVSDGGGYRCRAGRGNPVYYTHYSDAFWVNVTGESPSVSLIINPSRSQHFTAASLSLSCEDQRDSTGWTVRRYTHNETWFDCSSVSGSACYISSLSPLHTGVYWCESESGEHSDSVNITVHNGEVILDSPVHPVTEGNPLILRCLYRNTNISDSGANFYINDSIVQDLTAGEMTISSVSKSDKGFYYCKDPEIGESPKTWVSVRARPKPVVKIQPAVNVFIGETVTLTCDIQTGGSWKYHWYRNNEELGDATGKKTYTITDVEASDTGPYSCNGTHSSDPKYTQISDAFTLTVSEKPEPELTSDLKGAALTGNSVTLYCTLKLQSAGWKFYWMKDTQSRDTETETHSYTIKSVSVSDGGQYWCRAGRGNPVYYTHYSDALWVNITGESPPVSLIINPNRTQHFTADSLSLSCEGQKDSTGWTVRGHTQNELFNCSSISGSTCNISSLSPSHTGVYWCQSESGERSDSVNITVHSGDVILESPVRPVTEGTPLTLRCLHRDSKISVSGVYFYNKGSIIQNQARREMTINSISNSDEGFYHCKHPERGESPKSWITVKVSAPLSTVAIVGLSLSCVFVIIIILLILLLCYIKTKDFAISDVTYADIEKTNQRETKEKTMWYTGGTQKNSLSPLLKA
ncbi:hemicentin-1-like [Silurus meridionalis]|uniref:hemicentin-1-like n=1 Tax=Silurus meridionalis TaxID=175797 RepID=UPI001EE9D3FD|nr:hemicentin-1-like [Silurus meridionalis]XP_046707392.1 hemicentin-1-like [Silurus meridionalis]XP_046707393.1 hemicentin-1-like [Silurus meridionalis]XP_046707394.1 hemicentin-1-like [Silurus meridionalis]XP_046707395.1 hemicentin-1-like [Silurus meridionalis]XP_046707396.1 hemicentin-1-like [Silurus meridionalis]